jgi:hypothetical protein
MKHRRNNQPLVATIASWAALLIGAGVLFSFLRWGLQERFLPVLFAIVAVAVAVNIVFVVVWHRRPDLVDCLRERIPAMPAAAERQHGHAVRLLAAACSVVCGTVALAAGWLMWQAPDFALFAALWVVPAAYLAVSALYVAISGKSAADGTAFWLLFWPW